MNKEIEEILYELNDMFQLSELEQQVKNIEKIKNYINNLEKVADSRMDTILKIEQYCNDEKEDLIAGAEVCEDILKIIEEIK